jgi:uncharacterized protein (TIGR02246 family)
MKQRHWFWLVAAVSVVLGQSAAAQQNADEAAIRKLAESYVEAFNQKNAEQLAGLWAENAVYANPESGTEVVGREAIAQQLKEIFAQDGEAKLEVDVGEISFLSPGVALEHGTARVLRAGQPPDETSYSAVHVLRDGAWQIDRMSEQPVSRAISNYDKLKPLEWMMGHWVDQDEESTIETNCRWTKNHNFISRTFSVSVGDQVELSGIQIIGWDPIEERIRSWVFDSDGGFAEAKWTQQENRWLIHSAGTLPDGRKASSINILTMVDPNTVTWEMTGRSVDGEILPNIPPVKVTKKTEE